MFYRESMRAEKKLQRLITGQERCGTEAHCCEAGATDREVWACNLTASINAGTAAIIQALIRRVEPDPYAGLC
jgi:hypothetical protein